MAASMRLYACLLAILMMAGAMPSGTAFNGLSVLKEYGPSCSNFDDDAGGGGSEVYCWYSCGPHGVIGIGVVALDKDATAYGATSCGGASAPCGTTDLPTCVGTSFPEVTTYSQDKAKCRGETDEFWSSPVVIHCIVTSGDAKAELCEIDERLCTLAGLCTAALASQSSTTALARTLEAIDAAGVESFVAFEVLGQSIRGVSFSSEGCVAISNK